MRELNQNELTAIAGGDLEDDIRTMSASWGAAGGGTWFYCRNHLQYFRPSRREQAINWRRIQWRVMVNPS